MSTITDPKLQQLFFDTEQLLSYLYDRWQDESEYEDIKDYGNKVKPFVEAIGVRFVEMRKRPFGFTFTYDAKLWQVSMTASRYRMQSISEMVRKANYDNIEPCNSKAE